MMSANPSLVVLAAGLGSRYGSLKQIDQFGPSGETIVDYAIYDAIQAGFKKIVFVIKKDIEEEFKEIFLHKLSGKVTVEYAFQELDHLPEGFDVPANREKPWGTAHAVLMAESKIDEPFAIVNADDFYGRTSLKLMHDHLKALDMKQLSACMVGFVLQNTLSDHGRVSRGICQVDSNGMLAEIIERTHIFKGSETPYYEEKGQRYTLSGNEVVSMNLMGFTPHIFELMKERFKEFLETNLITKDLKAEYFIPSVLNYAREGGVKVPVLHTKEMWFGVTYQKDKPIVKRKLDELIKMDVYPDHLWK